MSFEIISYDSEHQDDIVDLWEKCNLIVPQNDPIEDIEKKGNFQPDLFLVALLDGQIIGSVMVGYDGHRGWLNYLAVLPNYRNRGYGRKLVERALEELRKLGCLKVNVQVRRSNPSAVEFYKHLGFKDDKVESLGMRLE